MHRKEVENLLADSLGFSDKIKLYSKSFIMYFIIATIYVIVVDKIFVNYKVVDAVSLFIFSFYTISPVTNAMMKKQHHTNMLRMIEDFSDEHKVESNQYVKKPISFFMAILNIMPPAIIWISIMISLGYVDMTGEIILIAILSLVVAYYKYKVRVFNYQQQLILTSISEIINKS